MKKREPVEQDSELQRVTFRLPKDLHRLLCEESARSAKSMNTVVVDRLLNSYHGVVEEGPILVLLREQMALLQQLVGTADNPKQS